MAAVINATPLMALDAVVIDTETTGLDPSKSFIVEIGAVKIVGGRVDADQTFRRLLRPPVPIPPQSSAIHGIDDGMVRLSVGLEDPADLEDDLDQALKAV